jgi:hypothetical protein
MNLSSINEVLEINNVEVGVLNVIKLVIIEILNIVSIIWRCRNNLRFNRIKAIWNSIIASIVDSVAMSGNQASLANGSDITDFRVLKAFKILITLSLQEP